MLSVSTRAVSATAAPTDPAPGLAVILTVSDPPTSGLYYLTSFTGSAVESANVNWQPILVNGAQTGGIDIGLYLPQFIGSGVYQDTVTVEVCSDSKCADQIRGSPVTIAVTYTVTGNAVSDASYAITPASISLEVTSNGAAPSSSIDLTAYDLPPYGAYVYYTSPTSGPVASMSFTQTSANAEPYAYGTGVLTVNMKDPASIGPGVYSSAISLSICYDQACTKPSAGSPFTIPVTYTVTASAGREFQQQVVNENFTALAVNRTGNLLYGATAYNTSGGMTVSQLDQIDPVTGAVTTLVDLPAPIMQIAPSQDGAYLYLLTFPVLMQLPTLPMEVLRVRTSDMTIDQTVALTNLQNEPAQIAVSPANSNTWSAAFSPQINVWEVEIFDDQVARPNVWSISGANIYGNEGIWSSDASTMYILDENLNAVPISAAGLGAGNLLQSGGTGFDYGAYLQLAGGLIYSENGQALNPQTNAIVGQFQFPSSVPYAELTLDTVTNRAFASYEDSVGDSVLGTIESFDLSNFSPLWIARLPVGTPPLRWGSNGLAWIGPGAVMGQQALYLISGTFVAP